MRDTRQDQRIDGLDQSVVSIPMVIAELPAPTRADLGFADVALTLILSFEEEAVSLEAPIEARR